MNSQNRICAAIVTYNRLEFLRDAIDSLKKQDYPCDILVVNNGSTDGTEEFLKDRKDLIIINQDNVGGAGGFNTALKYIAENGYELAWIMDDDIIADNNCLSQMVKKFELFEDEGEQIGFLCSKVVSPDGQSVNMPIIDNRPNSTGYSSYNDRLHDGLLRVLAATFVSVLIPTKNIFSVGLPYKEFFIWGDDTEYTLRLSQKNICYQVGASRIKHLRYGGKLSIHTMRDRNRIKMWRLFVRNQMFIAKKGYYGTDYFVKRCFRNVLTIGKLLVSLQFFKAKNCFIGFYQGLFFRPVIEYPVDTKNTVGEATTVQ